MTSDVSVELKSTREAQGLTLEDVSHETRIPVERLRLLEEGKFASFGSMAYARSFLRKYARFLNVKVEDLIEELPDPILGGESDYRYLTRNHGSWIDQTKDRTRPVTLRRRPATSPVIKVAAILVLVAVPAILWATHILGSLSSATTAKPATQEAAAVSPVTVVSERSSTEAAPSTAPTPIAWDQVNKASVRRAEVLPDDEAANSEVRRAVAAERSKP